MERKYLCPNWFIEELPKDISLDGELWMGRGTFEKLNKYSNLVQIIYHGNLLNIWYLIYQFK